MCERERPDHVVATASNTIATTALATQARIDLAVPRGAHWPKIDMPATRMHRFAAETFGRDRLAQHTDRRAVLDLFGAAVHRRRDARAPRRWA